MILIVQVSSPSSTPSNASEIPQKPNEDKLIDFGSSDAAITNTSTNLNNNFIDSNSSLITHNNLNNNNLVAASENNDERGEWWLLATEAIDSNHRFFPQICRCCKYVSKKAGLRWGGNLSKIMFRN